MLLERKVQTGRSLSRFVHSRKKKEPPPPRLPLLIMAEKAGAPKKAIKAERDAILLDEVAKVAYDVDNPIIGVGVHSQKWAPPPGLGEWALRSQLSGEATYPGIPGPVCAYRFGMKMLCPCGYVSPLNHCSGCPKAKFDGIFYRTVLHRAMTMWDALEASGYPPACIPDVTMPPPLDGKLLAALVERGVSAHQWVLEEEDRIAKNEFGDCEAFFRTYSGAKIVLGSQRMEILKGADPGPLHRLPWQTPLVMLYEAEAARLQLPEEQRGDEEHFDRVKALKWKGILLKQYQDAARALADAAAAENTADEKGMAVTDGSNNQPDVIDLLGVQDSPDSKETEPKGAGDAKPPPKEKEQARGAPPAVEGTPTA